MLLTAIIPIGTISRCHENLIHKLDQASKLNFKIYIVFDDISMDLAKGFLSQIETKENFNVFYGKFGQAGLARNRALKEVDTKWLVFWDSDDDFYPQKVLDMVLLADKNEAVGGIGNYELARESDVASPLLSTYQPEKSAQPDFDTALGIWRMAFRTDVVSQHRIEFPHLRVGEDVLFVLKFLLSDPKLFLFPDFVYKYSIGSSLQTTSIRSNSNDTLLIIRELLSHRSVDLSNSNHDLIRQLLVLQFLTLMRSFQKKGLIFSRQAKKFSIKEICLNCLVLIPAQSITRALMFLASRRKRR